jgi:hypothetical protein
METAWEKKDRLARERKTYQDLADLALKEIDEALLPYLADTADMQSDPNPQTCERPAPDSDSQHVQSEQ